MDIKEVRGLLSKLEGDIREGIQAFEKQTGCAIVNIALERLDVRSFESMHPSSVLGNLSIEVQI